MNLPENAIGPTDIQSYRDCPRRFAFGMRRWTQDGEPPEAQGPATAYGSAIHEAIAYVESRDSSDEDAIQRAFDVYAKWLEPGDLERMRTDLATYHEREYVGVRTVAVELELRVPLFKHDGEQIYLRTRIDRLYQRLDNPSVFIHVDYKSSRWPKTQAEVDDDRQLWLTNLLVFEHWPECETLVQHYDQLNFGVLSTRKTEAQRDLIRDWAVNQVTAVLHDDELPAKKNRWCPWCPIMESCPVVGQLSDYALKELAALAPARKDGRKTVLDLDPSIFEVYVEQLETVALARKVLDRFDETVRGALREMGDVRRDALGYRLAHRSKTTWPPEATKAAHDVLGDDFYDLVHLTQTAVKRLPAEQRDLLLDMAVREDGAPTITRKEN